jgi:hypothetical protein
VKSIQGNGSGLRRIAKRTAVSVLFLLPFSTLAGETPMDIRHRLAQVRSSVTSAELILLPFFSTYIDVVKESNLVRWGCAYKIDRPTELAGLSDAIERAQIQPNGQFAIDPRFRIVLTHRDGSTTRMLFEGVPRNKDGRLRGTVEGVAALASAEFPAELSKLVAGMTPAHVPPATNCTKKN